VFIDIFSCFGIFTIAHYFASKRANHLRVTGDTTFANVEVAANLVGVATESLIRAFSYFQEKNCIQLKGKQLRIEAPNKLKQFSEGHILK